MVGRILIVDDVATNRIVLKVKLAAACYDTLFATDGASCLRAARDLRPDLILMDRALPDLDGIEVLRRLRADPACGDVPVVMIAAQDDAEAKLAALRCGADEVLVKPIDDQMLMARLRGLLRARQVAEDLRARDAALGAIGLAEGAEAFETRGRIALVMQRPETAIRWRKDLAPHLTDHLAILSRDEALGLTPGGEGPLPDVFVIEADLGTGDGGLRLLSDLRSRVGSRHAAICVVVPETGGGRAAMSFDLGADDLVPATVDPRELAVRLRRLLRRKRHADRLRATVEDGLRLAVIDPLTGLYNRRYAMAQLARIAEGTQAGFAVMVIDLDRFKAVNDAWGHAAGDAVLVEVARRLSACLRPGDLVARIGGEEFLVAMPDTALADARVMAERLCRVVQSAAIMLPGGALLTVTVSIGLAIAGGRARRGDGDDPLAAIVDRADQALLMAKAEGRNQVTIGRSAA